MQPPKCSVRSNANKVLILKTVQCYSNFERRKKAAFQNELPPGPPSLAPRSQPFGGEGGSPSDGGEGIGGAPGNRSPPRSLAQFLVIFSGLVWCGGSGGDGPASRNPDRRGAHRWVFRLTYRAP